MKYQLVIQVPISLQQAVARLGVSKIREISLAIAFRVGVFKLKGFQQEVTALFQHSISAAFSAMKRSPPPAPTST